MGELVKKVKIDADDYQRGTDETGKRLKFISATQTCQRCAEPEPSPRPTPHTASPRRSPRPSPARRRPLSRASALSPIPAPSPPRPLPSSMKTLGLDQFVYDGDKVPSDLVSA